MDFNRKKAPGNRFNCYFTIIFRVFCDTYYIGGMHALNHAANNESGKQSGHNKPIPSVL